MYEDPKGKPRLETNTIRGMGHAVAIDLASKCGALRPYAEDVGICSSARIAQWFGIAQ
jgi:poly(3-hydroxybutyrate) depolymerase